MHVGTTNSGKSTSALSILDKLIEENKKMLIIDPTGEYRDSFSEQEVKKLNLGVDTIVSPSKLSMQQWSVLFERIVIHKVQFLQRQLNLCVISIKMGRIAV